MQIVVATHPSSAEHATGGWHPERAERVDAVLRGVRSAGPEVQEIEASKASHADLIRVHRPDYVDAIEEFCKAGGGSLDPDTVAVPESWEAALRSAGAVGALIKEIRDSPNSAGFAVTRPPGHHALEAKAMGFCLFNNVAVAAAALREEGSRVAILDWDVHHGNGTQEMLAGDDGVLYVSVHQGDFYPYDGHVSDIDLPAKGTNVNIPVPRGTGGDVVRRAWSELVIPVVSQFAPEWVLVSAGYDAHADDHLAELALSDGDYGFMASALAEVAPTNRVVLTLEGGYDLGALERSAAATVLGLAGEKSDDWLYESPPESHLAIDQAAEAIARYWTL